MRSCKKAATTLLCASLFLSLPACDTAPAGTTTVTSDTAEPSTEETYEVSEETTEMPESSETSADETEPSESSFVTEYMNPYWGETGPDYIHGLYSRRIYGGRIDSLLGYDNVYYMGEEIGPDAAQIFFYTEDNIEIAAQFGFNLHDPWIYSRDLDGDDVDELICPCQYTGDGVPCVLIYRNNNGVIEVGYPDPRRFEDLAGEELYALNCCSRYDFDTDRIVLYHRREELAELTIDDYNFYEYEPAYPFRNIWPGE